MVLFGVILLLPGVCAIIFGAAAVSERSFDPALAAWVLIGLAVGFAGIMLIREAIRGPRS